MLQYYLEFGHSRVELMSALHSTSFVFPHIHMVLLSSSQAIICWNSRSRTGSEGRRGHERWRLGLQMHGEVHVIYARHGARTMCARISIHLLECHGVEAPPRAHHSPFSSASSAAMAAKRVTEGIGVFVMVDTMLGSGFGVASGLEFPTVSP